MKPAIIYMLEVLVCSGVLLAAYAILLERRVKIPLVPALPAPNDLRRGPDSAAADSRMAGAHRRSRTRHLARPPPSGRAKCFPTRAEVSP